MHALEPALLDDEIGRHFSSSSIAMRASSLASAAPRQACAAAEAQVIAGVTADVEHLRSLELALVAVGGDEEQRDLGSGRDGATVQVDASVVVRAIICVGPS